MGQERRSWLERFNAAYPLLIAGIIASSNVSMTLMQTIIQSFGTLVILVALVIVEQHGIKDGIHLFLQDMSIAIFAAWAIVLANVVVDIIIVNIEHEARYKPPRGAAWSARLFVRNLSYRVGWSDNWKARPQSPAQILIQWKRFLTLVLFALALFGRMHVAIQEASTTAGGAKVDMGSGVNALLYKSSLQDFVVWTGGTLFTMLTVLSVQRMTHHIAASVIGIQDELKLRERNLRAAATRQRRRDEKEARAIARIATDESRLSSSVLSASTQTDTRQTGSGYVRVSSAVDKARQWLIDNPDKVDVPVRDLAQVIGVGKDSVAKARKELKG